MLILLAASLAIQAPEPTAEDARAAMAWGACIGLRARQFATRPDTDTAVASAVVAACADLERSVAPASIRMAGHQGGDEAVRRLHADVFRRALAIVREVRGGPSPSGPGTEFQIWGRCTSRHLTDRADGPGTPEEIVQAAERDCTAEQAAARAAAGREMGTAAGDAHMARIQAQGRELLLQHLAQIRASREARAPTGEPR